MRAVSAGWGVGVMPELLAWGPVADGSVVDLVPGISCPSSCTGTAGIWSQNCWTLTEALKATAATTLVT